MRGTSSTRARVAVAALFPALLAVIAAPRVADAHFVLEDPPSWMSQDALGLPQKLGPCGDELDGTDAATPTATVTTVQEGQTITVTIHEVIFHPGHYRISLAESRADLPAEPVVTVGSTPCGSAPIQSPPVLPVLADGVFVHTTAFTTPQSVQIKLPEGVTCTHCTLQVIEFMADHPLNVPGGCFYHHCADLAIVKAAADAGSRGDASTDAASKKDAAVKDSGAATSPDDAAADAGQPPPGSASGCGCRVGAAESSGGGLACVGLAILASARRRRRVRGRD
jgi:MYXO-CTERM domain-containing protein